MKHVQLRFTYYKHAVMCAAVATGIRNFPHDRGLVLGLLKSLFGLSASLFTLYYTYIFSPDAVSFLRFLAIVLPSVPFLCALVSRLSSHEEAARPLTKREHWKLLAGYGAIFSIAV
jgi:hypothetical protein